MRVDVAVAPALLSRPVPAGTDVVVLDVLRATSTIATALAHGATGIEPSEEVEAARARAGELSALLGGERDALPPPGFDLGNSPAAYTAAACGGRMIVLTTTNGTRAVAAVRGARRVLAGSLLNAEATARALVAGGAQEVLLVCAGRGGRVSADDVAGAGCLAGSLALLAAAEPSDAARVALALFDTWKHDLVGLFRRTDAGRNLERLGLASDLRDCSRVDALGVVAELDPGGVFRSAGGEA